MLDGGNRMDDLPNMGVREPDSLDQGALMTMVAMGLGQFQR